MKVIYNWTDESDVFLISNAPGYFKYFIFQQPAQPLCINKA